jgi:hypothetical protein
LFVRWFPISRAISLVLLSKKARLAVDPSVTLLIWKRQNDADFVE